MGNAFVIMPFGGPFDQFYATTLKKVLEHAGFIVQRADNISSQHSIMKDVVKSICFADLIVADLTTSNPNVYYELGVAHALNKKVVMLTKSIDEIPFDIKAYRVVKYGDHYADMSAGMEMLASIAGAALRGEDIFSNPVVDSVGRENFSAKIDTVEHDGDEIFNASGGLLDCIVGIMASLENLIKILGENNDSQKRQSDEIDRLNEKLQSLSPGDLQGVINISRLMAQVNEEHAAIISENNTKYLRWILTLQASVEALARDDFNADDAAKSNLEGVKQTVREIYGSAQAACSVHKSVLESIGRFPRMEKVQAASFDKLKNSQQQFCLNLEKTLEVFDKILAL
ncbi:MAG: hypothetical protein ACLGQW_07805 [Acidobacteriota bacterium]